MFRGVKKRFSQVVVKCLLCIACGIPFGCLAADLSVPGSSQAGREPAKPVKSNRGYSRQEVLVKSVDYKGFVARGANGITKENLNRLVNKLQLEWGVYFSVAEIHSLADQLTRFYHAAGFKFSRVIVPPQEITNGVLTLEVVEGTISDIQVRNADWYSKDQIIDELSELKYRVISGREVSDAIQQLNRYPGLQVYGYFSKGSEKNSTRLNINVKRETPYELQMKVDNYGSESTGLYRGLLQLSVNNPLNLADRLELGFAQSLDVDNEGDENNQFGSLRYQFPLFDSGVTMGLSAGNNQFELGQDFAVLGVEGEADIYQIDWGYSLKGARHSSSYLEFHINQKETTVSADLTTDILDEDETIQGLGLQYSLYRKEMITTKDSSRWGAALLMDIYYGEFETTYGVDSGRPIDDGDFLKLNVSPSIYLDFINEGKVSARALLSLKTQYTEDQLPDIETFSLSGPLALRSFESGLFSADRGGVLSFQGYWINGFWLNEYFTPFVFYEHGYGERSFDDFGNESRLRMNASGYGVGFDLVIPLGEGPASGIAGRFTFGWSDQLKVNRPDLINDADQLEGELAVYGELSYRFP